MVQEKKAVEVYIYKVIYVVFLLSLPLPLALGMTYPPLVLPTAGVHFTLPPPLST